MSHSLVRREVALLKARTSPTLQSQFDMLVKRVAATILGKGRIYLIGNGGSAAQAQHLAAELIGRFQNNREPYPAMALTTDTAAMTAIANDYGYEFVFSRQLEALATDLDTVIAFSTSGTSKSILNALDICRPMNCYTAGFASMYSSDQFRRRCKAFLEMPSEETPIIQELHLVYSHLLCEEVEKIL